MAQLTPRARQRLTELGREPISLPAEIYFGGNEQRQRTPGRHHLPEYQETGTYMHPEVVRNRLRIAMDRLERARTFKMSETEKAKVGGGEEDVVIKKCEQGVEIAQEEYAQVLGNRFKMEMDALNFTEKKPVAVPVVEAPKEEPKVETQNFAAPQGNLEIPVIEPVQGSEMVFEPKDKSITVEAPVKKGGRGRKPASVRSNYGVTETSRD